MNPDEYEIRRVKILDAQVEQEEDKSLPFSQSLALLIQDLESGSVLRTSLSEEDVKKLTNTSHATWTTKDLIDFSLLLRDREAPMQMMVPRAKVEINAVDLMKSRTIDSPQKKKRKRYRNKNRPQTAPNPNQSRNNS